jgi:hypothetical protein
VPEKQPAKLEENMYYEAQNPQMTVVEEAHSENEESAIYNQRNQSENQKMTNISKLQAFDNPHHFENTSGQVETDEDEEH